MARTVWFAWFGGPNYSAPIVDIDTETASSLEEVKRVMWSRYMNRDGSTPCVSDSEALVWFSDPCEQSDPYPDRIVRQSRGGASFRAERA